MKILIVNDDGYKSKGIEILSKILSSFGDVYISAPYSEQSAKSHGVSIGSEITIKEIEPIAGSKKTIAVVGTPADSTKVGLKYFDVDFDLVVSGINNGTNIGRDVIYSGTVAAATEARLYNYPSIAISSDRLDVAYIETATKEVLFKVINDKLYNVPGILNINLPSAKNKSVKGIKYTKLGHRTFINDYIKKADGDDVFIIKHHRVSSVEENNTDVHAFDNGYISITPLLLDRTCYNTYEELKK